MEYLSLEQVLELHRRLIEQSGGSMGVRDFGALESAIAQPQMTFGGQELYPTLIAKASAINCWGISMISQSEFERQFQEYWEWLRTEFSKGIPLKYSPEEIGQGKGNIRQVIGINSSQVVLTEITGAKRRSSVDKWVLKDDFWKLSQDSRVHLDRRSEIKKRHSITNLIEFVFEMFEEFERFVEGDRTHREINSWKEILPSITSSVLPIPEGLEQVADEDAFNNPRRERIPENVRNEVWRRDGGKCVRCGSRVKLEFDHIVPVSKGGSNTARNIELLCETCNRKKSNKIG